MSDQRTIKNAVITSVRLGREDHGIMTMNIGLDYGDSGHQFFGGYALDQYDASKKRRVGTAYGLEWIIRVLLVLDVNSLDQLVGTSVRVDAGWNRVYRIGHFLKDQWFDPDAMKGDPLCDL